MEFNYILTSNFYSEANPYIQMTNSNNLGVNIGITGKNKDFIKSRYVIQIP